MLSMGGGFAIFCIWAIWYEIKFGRNRHMDMFWLVKNRVEKEQKQKAREEKIDRVVQYYEKEIEGRA